MPELDLLLSVYVDDLILSGPKDNLPKGWKKIVDSGILLDKVEEPGLYLGCNRHFKTKTMKFRDPESDQWYSKKVQYVVYDMEDYLRDTVDRYKDLYKALTGQDCVLKACSTPFLPEDTQEAPMRAPSTFCPWCDRPFEGEGNPQDAGPASGGTTTRGTSGGQPISRDDVKGMNEDDVDDRFFQLT